jgi:hypothetical protein
MSKDNRKILLSEVKLVRDNILNDVHTKVVKIVEAQKDEDKKESAILLDDTRLKKIKFINENLYVLTDDEVDTVLKILKDENVINAKYDLLLEIVNEMLEHVGKPRIDELTDFKNIPRPEFSSEELSRIITDKKKKLEQTGFVTKMKKNMGQRSITKISHIPMLKTLCRKINYELVPYRTGVMVNNKRIFVTKYSISRSLT